MIALVLLFVFACNCIHYTPLEGQETSLDSFRGYAEFFKKTYPSVAKENRAYRNYVDSVKRVAEKNLRWNTQIYGVTKFADMSPREFKSKILMKTLKADYEHPKQTMKRDQEQSNPKTPIDWVAKNMTTAVKNQLQCGSCWTFSATETIESANIIAGKLSTSKWLAPQEIVDCDTGGYGCSGGWPSQAMNWVISQGGQDTESTYPYTGVDGTCAQSSGTVGATISSVVTVEPEESEMYTAIQTMPLSICADAASWQDYSNGVLPSSECGTSIDHAIQLTGYNPTQGAYWIVRNSWGTDWGLNGFIWLQYGQDTCGITSYVAYATV